MIIGVLVGTVVPPPVWSSIEQMFGEKRVQIPPPPPSGHLTCPGIKGRCVGGGQGGGGLSPCTSFRSGQLA
jgi:hypothetical protein